MPQQLGYSEWNNENKSNTNTNTANKSNRACTRKRRKRNNMAKIKQLLKNIEPMENDESADGLADFNPPSHPEVSSSRDREHESEEAKKSEVEMEEEGDSPVNNDEYKAFNNDAANNEYYKQYQNYYQQYVPYYTEAGNQQALSGDKSQLLEKLNYMINLLEEQKEHKTDNVTEELILYMFLGVFVIFVVDSFARAGKYTR